MELAQLAVFVRPPDEGMVKTRLQRFLGRRGATALYQAFVDDTLALCSRVREAGRVATVLWSAGVDDRTVAEWGRRLGTAPQPQPEGDLGVRLSAAFEKGLRAYERVVIIGSDAPTLPFDHIVAAFNALDDASMVLGPANDGGYYAIGATRRVRPRFDGVRWSTETAFQDTVLANSSIDIATLPPWYDVDEPADLKVLQAHLSADPRSAPATARCLRRLTNA